MNKVNYQKEMDKLILSIEKSEYVPTLLLHSCCAPCSSYVIEYLSQYFNITVYYYNPNINPDNEYKYRAEEQKRLIESMPVKHKVSFLEGDYQPTVFFDTVKGLENQPEGGARCEKCFALRLDSTAKLAKEKDFDYFATTLTISPLKNAQLINSIGLNLADKYQVKYLAGDFKKKNGYKRSIVLSKEYNLYRQNYCGCVFSKRDATLNTNENK